MTERTMTTNGKINIMSVVSTSYTPPIFLPYRVQIKLQNYVLSKDKL